MITSLSELFCNFTILLVQTKKDFYKLWQQCKHLNIMENSEAQPNIDDEEYMHQFKSGPTNKFQ